jgi:oligopeptide transport system ATP-binding protein
VIEENKKSNQETIVKIKKLKKYFEIGGGFFSRSKEVVKAVDGLNFEIYKGETLGLVGESGCGKSTTGRLLLRLLEPTEGEIFFEGSNLTDLNGKPLKEKRKDIQMVFQDPYASLNPRMSIEKIISEPLWTHNLYKGNEKKRVKELMEAVNLPMSYADRYPHEFSGGQRQRIGIARALAVSPKFIVADEPVSALDVSIQAQIINLMNDLQEEFGLTYLFIAHDLSVVEYISDRVGVMYLGQLVELTDSDKLYNNPIHPYTKALLSAIPLPDPDRQADKKPLEGEIPSPVNPPSGCRFNTRCWLAEERCRKEQPQFKEIQDGHYVACHVMEDKYMS